MLEGSVCCWMRGRNMRLGRAEGVGLGADAVRVWTFVTQAWGVVGLVPWLRYEDRAVGVMVGENTLSIEGKRGSAVAAGLVVAPLPQSDAVGVRNVAVGETPARPLPTTHCYPVGMMPAERVLVLLLE